MFFFKKEQLKCCIADLVHSVGLRIAQDGYMILFCGLGRLDRNRRLWSIYASQGRGRPKHFAGSSIIRPTAGCARPPARNPSSKQSTSATQRGREGSPPGDHGSSDRPAAGLEMLSVTSGRRVAVYPVRVWLWAALLNIAICIFTCCSPVVMFAYTRFRFILEWIGLQVQALCLSVFGLLALVHNETLRRAYHCLSPAWELCCSSVQ